MPTSRRTLLKNSAAARRTQPRLDARAGASRNRAHRRDLRSDRPVRRGGSVASSVGAQIAIDLVNEKGGVGGKYKVVPVNADSQSKPDVAINEAERLINQEKIDIINGVYASSHAVPLAAKVEQQKKILWITTAVATAVFKDKNLQYVFRAQIHSDQYGQAFAGFLTEHAKEKLGMEPKDVKVALIHEDGPYGVGVAAADEAYSKEAGLQIVLKEGYSAVRARPLGAGDQAQARPRRRDLARRIQSRHHPVPAPGARERPAFQDAVRRRRGLQPARQIARERSARTSTISAISIRCRRNCSTPQNSRPASAISPRPWSSATRRKPARPTFRRTARWASTRPGSCSTTSCPSPRRNTAASIPRRFARRRSTSTSRRAARSRATASNSTRRVRRCPARTNARRRW